MKRKLFTTLFAGVLTLGVLFTVTSCGNDDFLSDREIQDMIDNSLNGQWKTVNVDIKKNSWTWNEQSSLYEAVVELPEYNSFIHELGITVVYYMHNETGKTALPFLLSIKDEEGMIYTRNISCDLVLGEPSLAVFALQSSDLIPYDQGVPLDMKFQIQMIW